MSTFKCDSCGQDAMFCMCDTTAGKAAAPPRVLSKPKAHTGGTGIYVASTEEKNQLDEGVDHDGTAEKARNKSMPAPQVAGPAAASQDELAKLGRQDEHNIDDLVDHPTTVDMAQKRHVGSKPTDTPPVTA